MRSRWIIVLKWNHNRNLLCKYVDSLALIMLWIFQFTAGIRRSSIIHVCWLTCAHYITNYPAYPILSLIFTIILPPKAIAFHLNNFQISTWFSVLKCYNIFCKHHGLVAQLGERCVRNAEVEGSNPFRSMEQKFYKYGSIAQLGWAFASHARGHGFEPHYFHWKSLYLQAFFIPGNQKVIKKVIRVIKHPRTWLFGKGN